MLQFFRNFFQSKLGIPVTLGFLAIIAIAFASSDVSNTGTFGGVAGGDRVAVVGDHKISSAEYEANVRSALEQMRENDPTMSMPAFVSQGGPGKVLDQMIDRAAIAAYARQNGMRAGENLVNSEILTFPQFRGANGEFDETVFRRLLGSRNLKESDFRRDLASGLLAKQLLIPVAFGAQVPDKLALRYASLLKEKRSGGIAIVPSRAFAPKGDPKKGELEKYYAANSGDFIRPERRVIRYAVFGEDAIGKRAAPTDAEIRARYEKDQAKYAASENRTFTQLIVPTQQAAKAIRDKVAAGGSLEAAASEAGFATGQLGPLSRSELAAQSSPEVAKAIFEATQGAVAAPARSGLGWHVARIDKVDKVAARSLDQVRGEIADQLATEKRQNAIADLAASVEDELGNGASLADVAKELGVTVETSQPLVADGTVYGGKGGTAPEVLAPALQTAFQMEEGEPQLAQVGKENRFLVFEAGRITPSAAAPLAEIRDDVVEAWRMAEGSKAARAAVDRILKRMKDGSSLAAAVAKEDKPLPTPESVNVSREQLAQMQGRVPPPLALMFSMAKGTSKKLEAPDNAGWFVVDLDTIEAGKIDKDDPIVAQASKDLGGAMGNEYAEQFSSAMRGEVGVERNKSAIDAIGKRLAGQN